MEPMNRTAVQTVAQNLLRETGYNATQLRAAGEIGEAYSRAMGLWREACKLVREVFPDDEAADMIRNTYNPEQAWDDADAEEEGDYEPGEPWDGFRSDAEADADALASAGWGTDEDYGGDCERF